MGEVDGTEQLNKLWNRKIMAYRDAVWPERATGRVQKSCIQIKFPTQTIKIETIYAFFMTNQWTDQQPDIPTHREVSLETGYKDLYYTYLKYVLCFYHTKIKNEKGSWVTC